MNIWTIGFTRYLGQSVTEYLGQWVIRFLGQLVNGYLGHCVIGCLGQWIFNSMGHLLSGSLWNWISGAIVQKISGYMIIKFLRHCDTRYLVQWPLGFWVKYITTPPLVIESLGHLANLVNACSDQGTHGTLGHSNGYWVSWLLGHLLLGLLGTRSKGIRSLGFMKVVCLHTYP